MVDIYARTDHNDMLVARPSAHGRDHEIDHVVVVDNRAETDHNDMVGSRQAVNWASAALTIGAAVRAYR